MGVPELAPDVLGVLQRTSPEGAAGIGDSNFDLKRAGMAARFNDDFLGGPPTQSQRL